MKKKKTRNIKRKNHDNIVDDYDKQKSKHLDKLAKRMLDNDEKFSRLRERNIDDSFLDLF
tara:strand:- start:542 stop:721 length:180 start_codon:yes stop_codon:yes gene_type:complete